MLNTLRGLRIGTKLSIGFGIVFFFTVLLGVLVTYQMRELGKVVEDIHRHPFTVSNAVRLIERDITAMHRTMKDIVLETDLEKRREHIRKVKELEERVYKSFEVVFQRFLGKQDDVQAAYREFRNWEGIRDEVIYLMQKGARDDAAKITQDKGANQVTLLESKIKIMSDFANNKANEFLQAAVEKKQNAFYLMVGAVAFLLMLLVVIFAITVRETTRPLLKAIGWIGEIEEGHFTRKERWNESFEIASLMTSINSLVDMLEKNDEKNRAEKYIKDGESHLVKELGTYLSPSETAQKSLDFVCRYMKAGSGVLYLYNPDKERLELAASYATDSVQAERESFSLGEGVIGEVARQKIPMLLEGNSGTQIIQSSFQRITPLSTYVYPLTYEDTIIGVVELAFLQTLSETRRNFLEITSEVISRFLFIANQSEQIHIALQKSHYANETLQKQSVEIQQKNMQMEVQQHQLEKTKHQLEELNTSLKEQVEQEVYSRLQVEKEKQEREKLLIQQSKMAEVGNMIGAITHQWRQPLNTMMLLMDAFDPDEPMNNDLSVEQKRDNVERIKQQILFLSETITQFRNYFKPSSEEREFSLVSAIQNIYMIIKPKLDSDYVNVRIEGSERTKFMGMESEFKHVMMNLINNARDAIAQKNIKNGEISITVAESEKEIDVIIEDNGGGIPENLLPDKIFESYFSTKGEQGTGIGLSISKNIIEKGMGGQLKADNTEEGAKFIISFQKVGSPPMSVIKGTILIVEDEELSRNIMHKMLKKSFSNVLSAENGQKALELLEAHQDEVVIVLSDIDMPVLNGAEMAEQIREKYPDLPVVALSAISDQSYNQKLFDLVLEKPIKQLWLMEQLQSILRKK